MNELGETATGGAGKISVNARLMLLQIAQKSGTEFDGVFGNGAAGALGSPLAGSAKIDDASGAMPVFAKST